MGLLKFVNKVFGNDFHKNMDSAIRRYKPELINIIFPGGVEQAKRFVRSVSVVIDEEYHQYGEIKCDMFLKFYFAFVLDKVNNKLNDVQIRKALIKNSTIINENNVDSIMALCYLSMADSQYELGDNVKDFSYCHQTALMYCH